MDAGHSATREQVRPIPELMAHLAGKPEDQWLEKDRMGMELLRRELAIRLLEELRRRFPGVQRSDAAAGGRA
ncbi:hypothetical protein JW921_06765 [Candidatus Fermentibacterales bacterium]|nr:hypothetical protein [Candidatus Fermentibacterales bacterium]